MCEEWTKQNGAEGREMEWSGVSWSEVSQVGWSGLE